MESFLARLSALIKVESLCKSWLDLHANCVSVAPPYNTITLVVGGACIQGGVGAGAGAGTGQQAALAGRAVAAVTSLA